MQPGIQTQSDIERYGDDVVEDDEESEELLEDKSGLVNQKNG